MSEEQKDIPPEDRTPPMPDVPASDNNFARTFPSGSGGKEDPGVDDATRKMADDIESGRSPYKYDREPEAPSGGGSSSVVTPLLIAVMVVTIGVAALFGWDRFSEMSGKLERMSKQVHELSGQLAGQRKAGKQAGRAVIKMELRKTLNTLERTIALGDADATAKALELRNEVNAILASFDRVSEPAPTKKAPETQIQQKTEVKPQSEQTVKDVEPVEVEAEAAQSAAPPAPAGETPVESEEEVVTETPLAERPNTPENAPRDSDTGDIPPVEPSH